LYILSHTGVATHGGAPPLELSARPCHLELGLTLHRLAPSTSSSASPCTSTDKPATRAFPPAPRRSRGLHRLRSPAVRLASHAWGRVPMPRGSPRLWLSAWWTGVPPTLLNLQQGRRLLLPTTASASPALSASRPCRVCLQQARPQPSGCGCSDSSSRSFPATAAYDVTSRGGAGGPALHFHPRAFRSATAYTSLCAQQQPVAPPWTWSSLTAK
jgi:hypothetical protein